MRTAGQKWFTHTNLHTAREWWIRRQPDPARARAALEAARAPEDVLYDFGSAPQPPRGSDDEEDDAPIAPAQTYDAFVAWMGAACGCGGGGGSGEGGVGERGVAGVGAAAATTEWADASGRADDDACEPGAPPEQCSVGCSASAERSGGRDADGRRGQVAVVACMRRVLRFAAQHHRHVSG